MNTNRVRLKVLGMSTGEITPGAYALILAEVNGPVRMAMATASDGRASKLTRRSPSVKVISEWKIPSSNL